MRQSLEPSDDELLRDWIYQTERYAVAPGLGAELVGMARESLCLAVADLFQRASSILRWRASQR